jgi:hypothetical protein
LKVENANEDQNGNNKLQKMSNTLEKKYGEKMGRSFGITQLNQGVWLPIIHMWWKQSIRHSTEPAQ